MCLCNLNARFTPIFVKITLIPDLLMFCRIRRKIKQSDGRNQVKRKLLICSSLLTVAKRFGTAKLKSRNTASSFLGFILVKEFVGRGEAVCHYEGKASSQQSPSKQR